MAHAARIAPPTVAEPDLVPVRTSARARREAALDEHKRAFLRLVSHELRTPLNSVLGFSELIASELYGPLGAPQYKEYAGIIRASGERLLRLVNQVLEIARLEGHAMDLDLRPESLDHALDDVLDALGDEIAARRMEVVIEGHGALPCATADPRGLRTLLTNLIQNAVAFSPEGSQVRIMVSGQVGRVAITIRDQGPGIDPQDVTRLLKPFEQGQNTLTRRTEGAGLGLPIVDLLCRAMHGRLTLRPAPEGGLDAVVTLPTG